MTKAEEKALDGLDAFKTCDMRTAHGKFTEAYDLDQRADFAFAFALTDLALLVEDPSVQSVLPRLGFTASLRSDFLWQKGGLLDKLAAKDQRCEAIGDWLRTQIPHPSAPKNGPAFRTTVDATLTAADLVSALQPLGPRLEKVVGALEKAGDGYSAPPNLESGCGVGSLKVQRVDLYLLAAMLESLRAGILTAPAYDWDLNVHMLVDTYDSTEKAAALATALNAHLFHSKNAAQWQATKPMLVHIVSLARKALQAQATAGAAPDGAIFDYSKVPSALIADMQRWVDYGSSSLSTTGLQTVPSISPSFSVDVGSLFTNPLALDGLEVWYAESPWTALYSHDELWHAMLASHMSDNPWTTATKYQYVYSDTWKLTSAQLEAIFNPKGRWSNAYECEGSEAYNPLPL